MTSTSPTIGGSPSPRRAWHGSRSGHRPGLPQWIQAHDSAPSRLDGTGDTSGQCGRLTIYLADLAAIPRLKAPAAAPVKYMSTDAVDTATALESGQFNKVPVIQGINHDEWQLMIGGMEALGAPPLTPQTYPAPLAQWFDENAAAVEREYPLSAYPKASKALSAALTDEDYAVKAWTTSELFAKHVPTYSYDLTVMNAPWFTLRAAPSWPVDSDHILDVAFLFDVDFIDELNDDQREVSAAMIDYWTSFARTGMPTSSHAPSWPRHTAHHPAVQFLGPDGQHIGQVDFAADHHLDFWKSLTK
jgi:para-nitrobenzyl esterase